MKKQIKENEDKQSSWKVTSAIHSINKTLASRIHEELLQFNKKKPNRKMEEKNQTSISQMRKHVSPIQYLK